ncbi:MAG: hypothetical protein IK085_00850, partial [Clostridia bacterium]|nr:hypothetical protein [Clostridia bacterium]
VIWQNTTGQNYASEPIIVYNASNSAVISVTNLKYSYNERGAAANANALNLSFSFSGMDLLACSAAFAAIDAKVNAADSTGVTATWDKESIALGQTATLTIKANENFEKAFVDGAEVAGYSEQDGERVWTYTFTPVQTGENAFDVTLLDINGYTTQPIATSIKAVAPTVSVSDAQISWEAETVTLGDKAVLTITTPANIVKVTIGDTEITEYTETENGRQFTFETTPESAGVFRYSVILTEIFGYSSANGTTPGITVKVPAADEPDTPENPENPDNPDNPGTDDEPEKELNFFEKLVKFFTELFAKVINIFKKAVN